MDYAWQLQKRRLRDRNASQRKKTQADAVNGSEISGMVDHKSQEAESRPVLDYKDTLNEKRWSLALSTKVKLTEACCFTAVCFHCGKLLRPDLIHFASDIPRSEWRAASMVPSESIADIVEKVSWEIVDPSNEGLHMRFVWHNKVSCCYECKQKISKGANKNMFDYFGSIPACFQTPGLQVHKLGLASLYCNVYRPAGLGLKYLHCTGNIGFSNNSSLYQGMLGVIFGSGHLTKPVVTDKEKSCLSWLKRHNPLYQKFVAHLETLRGYFQPQQSGSVFSGLPEFTPDMELLDGKQFTVSDIPDKVGYLVPQQLQVPRKPVPLTEVTIGSELPRQENCKATKISYTDPDLEAKIFPHLFPWGLGSWCWGKDNLTLGAYHKMRLLHVDRRWANDRRYLFFAFDRNMKSRIFAYNNIVTASNRSRPKNLTAGEVQKGDNYFLYGQRMPLSVPGSKAFWQSKWLDLVALVSARGPPTLFVTLTANDSWPSLQQMLKVYPKPVTTFHPVDTTEFFFNRLAEIKHLMMKKHILGKIVDSWFRVESQNRGALHVHALLWIEDGILTPDVISAVMPRGSSKEAQLLRELVRRYQIHNCIPNRCHRTWQGKTTDKCKYGFPFVMRDDDGYDIMGQKYEYKRTEVEDQRVVPYNAYLLLAWQAHLNVLRVTSSGFERYLVKYVAKVEPSFGLRVDYQNEVHKYLETRLIGAPEAAAIVLGHPLVSMSAQVVFLDTNRPHSRSRRLKAKEELTAADPDSTDVFAPSAREHYTMRPNSHEFINITLLDYVSQYEVFVNANRNVPKCRLSMTYTDRSGHIVAKRRKPLIPRYRFLTAVDGEDFFFQRLLLMTPYTSEKDLLSESNVTQTYQEECYLRGVFQEEDELDASFLEMKKRNFDPNSIAKVARKMLLEDCCDPATISGKLNAMDYGEPIPFELDGIDDNLDKYETLPVNFVTDTEPWEQIGKILQCNKQKILACQEDLAHRMTRLTDSQRNVFDHICSTNAEQVLAFVTGPGGVGKSFLLHTIVLHYEFAGKVVEVMATSGNAALLINGMTVHSFFKLDSELQTSLQYMDSNWQCISSTDVIIIDEVSMMTAELLEQVHLICSSTADEMSRQKWFGGKTIILFGDLFQLPAVLSNVVSRQVYSSHLWKKFKPFFLTEQCRQKGDTAYGELLNRVRTGSHTSSDLTLLQTRVCGSGHEQNGECQALTDEGSVIICSKHDQRHAINLDIQRRLFPQEEMTTLEARDYNSQGQSLSFVGSRMIDNMKGSLPSLITLCIGTKVVVTRNLDLHGGVVNGTCGVVKAIHQKCVVVQKLGSAELIPVTKVKQKLVMVTTKTIYYRLQFPLILGWACTVHRMQGATLDKAYIHMDRSFFAGGQAYVALSRVKSLDNLHLLSFDPSAIFCNPVVKEIMAVAEKEGKLSCSSKTSSVLQTMSAPEETSQSKNLDNVLDSTHVHKPEDIPCSSVQSTSTNSSTESKPNSLKKKRKQGEQTHDMRSTIPSDSAGTSKMYASEKPTSLSEPLWPDDEGFSFQYREALLQQLPDFVAEEDLDLIPNILTTLASDMAHLLEKLRSNPRAIYRDCILSISEHVQQALHPSFSQHYVAISTPPDGNCLWHAVSITLCGSTALSKVLRLATVFVLLQYRQHFEQMFCADQIHSVGENQPVPQEQPSLLRKLYVARHNREWGDEYHMYALSIALQKDIFVYTDFRDIVKTRRGSHHKFDPPALGRSLQHAFERANMPVRRHLVYAAAPIFKSAAYSDMPLCTYFLADHYTAILPRNSISTIFRPARFLLPIGR